MKILIDVCHPADVHLYKNFINIMKNKGNLIKVTARHKEITYDLLKSYDIEYEALGNHKDSIVKKIIGLFVYPTLLIKIMRKFKPDIVLSLGSVYAAIASYIIRIPHVTFEDTGNMEQILLYRPFTDVILTPNLLEKKLGKKQIKIKAYKELAYLHPNHFVPNRGILENLGVKENEKYVLLRFVGWTATHDKGHNGISLLNKIKIVTEFSQYAKVFISSEKKLPRNLTKYKIDIRPERMHDVIAFASLVFGESATMVSEAAVLGTPGIYLDDTGRIYTREQEDYGLVYNYSESLDDQNKAILKGMEILSKSDNDKYEKFKEKLILEKIDLTAFTVWFIENYPESIRIMKKNPDYQNRFK